MPRSPLGSKREVRPGVWEVRVSVGYRRDGSPRQSSRTVHGTEADADAAILRLATDMGRAPTMGDRMTVDDYVYGVFLPRKRGSRTKATYDYYLSAYRTHIAEDFGQMDIGSVPKSAIRSWAARLPAQSAPSYVRALRAILRSAWEDGLIADEPMRGRLELPSRDTRPAPVWSADVAAEAMRRMVGADVEPLALLMLGAGLSASEARARDWSDLSADCSEVRVDSAYTQRDGMKQPKNARRYRTVPLLPVCADRLRELRGEGPVCLNRRGQRMGPATVSRRWKALYDPGAPLDGIPWLPMNRLRATHETLMLRAGVPDALNAAIHGHSQKVAYSNYLAPATAEAVGAARAAGSVLGGRNNNLHFVD